MADPLNTDLSVTWRGLEATTDGASADEHSVGRGDLRLNRGRDNLAQALTNRLSTRRGALANLGHAAYGSRLHQLVGEPDTPRTRALAEYYIREAIGREPRVLRVVDVTLAPPTRQAGWRETLVAQVTVLAAGDPEPLMVAVSTGVGV